VHGLFQNPDAPRCPDRVVEAVLAQVDAEPARPVRRAAAPAPRRSLTGWMAAAVAVALVVLALLPSRPDAPTPAPTSDTPTLAEIEAAAEDMRTAFAVVSRSIARTTGILDEHLRGHVTTPVLQGLERGGIRPAASQTSAINEHSGLVSPPLETRTAHVSSGNPDPWS